MKCEKCHSTLGLTRVDYPEIKYVPIDGIISGAPMRANDVFKFTLTCPVCHVSIIYPKRGQENAEQFYNSIIKPMKNIIEQTRKIKGVATVEKAGEGMAVVVFEAVREPIFTTVDGVSLYNSHDKSWWVDLRDFRTGIQPFTHEGMESHGNYKYFSTNDAAVLWAEENKPRKSLKPEELVDGEIYATKNERIFRFKTMADSGYIKIYSQLFCGGFHKIDEINCMFYDTTAATLAEKQTLIRAEVENGYFYNLK